MLLLPLPQPGGSDRPQVALAPLQPRGSLTPRQLVDQGTRELDKLHGHVVLRGFNHHGCSLGQQLVASHAYLEPQRRPYGQWPGCVQAHSNQTDIAAMTVQELVDRVHLTLSEHQTR